MCMRLTTSSGSKIMIVCLQFLGENSQKIFRAVEINVASMFRAIGSSFEVLRPSGRVRLCLLVFFNVIKSCHSQYTVLVKLIQQS